MKQSIISQLFSQSVNGVEDRYEFLPQAVATGSAMMVPVSETLVAKITPAVVDLRQDVGYDALTVSIINKQSGFVDSAVFEFEHIIEPCEDTSNAKKKDFIIQSGAASAGLLDKENFPDMKNAHVATYFFEGLKPTAESVTRLIGEIGAYIDCFRP